MTYDAAAQQLAITAIGTFHTGMNYLTVGSPARVGLFGWSGARAAASLQRLKTENPSAWSVPATLDADLTTYPVAPALYGLNAADADAVGLTAQQLDSLALVNETFWMCRYFTADEAYAVSIVLNNGKSVQNEIGTVDVARCARAATFAGFDLNVNTAAALFFMVMYSDDPASALDVVAGSGPTASIQRLYAAALNIPTLAAHRAAYGAAYTVITGAVPDVQTTPDPTPAPPADGGNPSGSVTGTVQLVGAAAYAVRVGDALHLKFSDGHTVVMLPTSGGYYIPRQDATTGAPVPSLPDNPAPTTPPSSGADATRSALVTWVTSRVGRYAYSQGPTRLNPEQNMYTDCSGLMYWTFQQVAGIDIGTWTGSQVGHGTLVAKGSGTLDQSQLLPGDLVFYNWSRYKSTYDHVDMFVGGGNVCGHGGPGSGPNTKTLAPRISAAHDYMVRRYV